jgi:hypothetical protein
MIPMIIHQTWKTNDIPNEWSNAVESCKNLHKDFKYILWTDDTMLQFVKEKYHNFYNVYISYKYDIQRCDAFRYLVLYEYGGIYLDLDIICKKKLTDLLKYDLVIAKSSNINTSYTNSFMMTKPKNNFIKYCIEQLPKTINSHSYFGRHLHVMNSTGPLFLSNIINESLYFNKHVRVINNDPMPLLFGIFNNSNNNSNNIQNCYVLSKNEFSGDCSVCNTSQCSGGIYFNHEPGKSWNSIDSIIYNYILCNNNKNYFNYNFYNNFYNYYIL